MPALFEEVLCTFFVVSLSPPLCTIALWKRLDAREAIVDNTFNPQPILQRWLRCLGFRQILMFSLTSSERMMSKVQNCPMSLFHRLDLVLDD